MKWIFKRKSKLRILVDTGCDLSGYKNVTICAKKPDNSLVQFSAVVKDVEHWLVFYDLQTEEDLDVSGWWVFWVEVVFDDDRTSAGRAFRIFVHEVGSV